jgi:hypothetical protein
MKKSLKISDTFLGSFTMSLFSLKVIELFVFTPLLDKKGFIYHNFETTFIKVVDKNIPLKKKKAILHILHQL